MGISPDNIPDDSKPKIVMGYPSMDRYNHHAQMYSPNQPLHAHVYSQKSPFHDQHNPYPQQQYDPYYDQQHYKTLVPEQENNVSFGSMMLILMIILLSCMGLMSLVMWFLFGTTIPQFEVRSFRVSNFSATNTNFTGMWATDFTVMNTNHELDLDFYNVRSAIFYQETLLGIYALFEPMNLKEQQGLKFGFNLTAEKMENPNKFASSTLPAMAHDRSNGVMVFSMRLAMTINFISGNTVYRKENLRVFCENLVVKFSESGEGTYTPGLMDKCLIRLRGDSLD